MTNVPADRPPQLGLTNPYAERPIFYLRSVAEERKASKGRLSRFGWRVRVGFYRSWRVAREAAGAIADEVTSTPKKTLIDVLINAPIGLLVLPSVRTWAAAWPYATLVFGGLVALKAVYGAWRRGRVGEIVREQVGQVQRRLLPVVECAQIHVQAAAVRTRLPDAQTKQNIQTCLSAIAEICASVLQVPRSVKVQANLMMRMPVYMAADGSCVEGAGIVAYDTLPAEPSWTRLVLGDFGAGEVFQSGRVQAVEDTEDPVWCGVFSGSRSKCFASFPVHSGSWDVIAVVNVDASRSRVFTRPNATKLYMEVLAPPLKLLSDLLVASHPGALNTIPSRRSEPTR